MLAAGLEDVPGAAHVDLERLHRRFAGDADDRLRGEVEDGIAAGDRGGDRLGVAQVALGKLDLVAQPEQVEGGAARPADVSKPRVGPVEHAHGVAPRQQRAARCEATNPCAPVTKARPLTTRPPSGALYPRIWGQRRTGSSLGRRSARHQGWPGGLAGGPEVVELDRVLVGVHAIPEALVAERR